MYDKQPVARSFCSCYFRWPVQRQRTYRLTFSTVIMAMTIPLMGQVVRLAMLFSHQTLPKQEGSIWMRRRSGHSDSQVKQKQNTEHSTSASVYPLPLHIYSSIHFYCLIHTRCAGGSLLTLDEGRGQPGLFASSLVSKYEKQKLQIS